MAGKRGNGEGSIVKRTDGYWVARITLPNGKRRALYGKTRQEAAAKLIQIQREVQQGAPSAAGKEALGQFLARYFTDIAPVDNRPATIKHYRMDVRLYIVPALGKLKVREVTVQRIQQMLNALTARGLGPATIEHCRATLRVALQHAIKEGLILQNSAMLVRTPTVLGGRIEALTPTQARALIAAFDGHWLEPLVVISLATGLRQGELLGLAWDDVDLDAGVMAINQQLQRVDGVYVLAPLKTDRSRRTLALPPMAVEILRAHKAHQNADRLRLGAYWANIGRVFTTAAGGYLNGSTVTHSFQKQLKAAGLPALKWHGLRHGCASLMIAEGKDTRRIMEQLGHSQISVAANTYSHISAALMLDTASALQRALTGTG